MWQEFCLTASRFSRGLSLAAAYGYETQEQKAWQLLLFHCRKDFAADLTELPCSQNLPLLCWFIIFSALHHVCNPISSWPYLMVPDVTHDHHATAAAGS
eukprot:872398-Pelagomonas_calceolata.AAC.5